MSADNAGDGAPSAPSEGSEGGSASTGASESAPLSASEEKAQALGQPAPAKPAAAPKSAIAPLKVDGKEIPVKDEAELRAMAQKGIAAEARMREAAEARKEMETLRREKAELGAWLKSQENQRTLMRKLHEKDPAAYRQFLADELYEIEIASPEERARIAQQRQMGQRLTRAEEIERREQERLQAEQQRQQQEAQQAGITKAQESYRAMAAEAFPAHGLDPSDPTHVELWAANMLAAAENNERLEPAEAARRVAEKLGGAARGRLAKLSDEQLLEELRDVLPRVRKADAARLKGAQRNPAPGQAVRAPNGQFTGEKQTTSDWLARLQGRARG